MGHCTSTSSRRYVVVLVVLALYLKPITKGVPGARPASGTLPEDTHSPTALALPGRLRPLTSCQGALATSLPSAKSMSVLTHTLRPSWAQAVPRAARNDRSMPGL